ncbi:MAG: hypothetical protein HYT28_01845 [Parcubacteria group bacterium]|nr:hypothetical protein [Parcubacteria group bacterium]
MTPQNNFEYQKIIRGKEKKEFRVGDQVGWGKPTDKEMRLYIKMCRACHGNGPFIVAKTEKVPRGDSRKAVGHGQYVWLENIQERFSGAFLRIIKKRKYLHQ